MLPVLDGHHLAVNHRWRGSEPQSSSDLKKGFDFCLDELALGKLLMLCPCSL